MLSYVLPVAVAILGIAMALNLWRLARGPDATDRILALDTLAINTVALVMLLGILRSSVAYYEVALLIAMMGFVGTVALSKFLIRGSVIE